MCAILWNPSKILHILVYAFTLSFFKSSSRSAPPLRGRSPSYLARQLIDFREGTRHGVWAPLMVPVVANLTAEDILDLAAYLASLPPAP